MDSALASRARLDGDTLWRTMRTLIDRVFGVLERESVLDDCLDILVDLIGADRGLVLVVAEDGSTRTINARARGKTLGPLEREEISKTLIHRVLETNACVTWDMSSMASSSSVNALGILGALAAPLHRQEQGSTRLGGPRAVLYVDVRDQRKHVESQHVEFFMSAALVIGELLDLRARGENDRARLGAALRTTIDTRQRLSLDDLVSFDDLRSLRDEIASAMKSDLPVLLLGESGTGKTLIAQAIAEAAGRLPIVRATLGGSDDLTTITSELFGHERGSFSGASGRRVGLVELAEGGTLILDELLNLPPHAQKLLLDFTQFGTYRPLGYDRAEPKRSRVRIVGATNGDLASATRDGRFRADLFHRLAGVVLELPPLRQRRADIPSLTESILRRSEASSSRRWSLSVGVRRLLLSPTLEWSGNVRQLERVVLRARDRALLRDPEATELVVDHFEARDLDGVSPATAGASAEPARSGAESNDDLATRWQQIQADRARSDEAEQELMRRALGQAQGNLSQAARSVGVARTTFQSRLEACQVRTRAKRDA
jgi:transcriptional regulator with GAF, ATPase, and Fis domain